MYFSTILSLLSTSLEMLKINFDHIFSKCPQFDLEQVIIIWWILRDLNFRYWGARLLDSPSSFVLTYKKKKRME